MGNYIKTESVEVFPSSLRTEKPEGKFTTEENLTNFLKAVTDRGSFVIADPHTDGGEGPHFNKFYYLFIINGYFFKAFADDIDKLTFEYTDRFACMRLDIEGRLIAWDGSSLLDSENLCKALFISDRLPSVSFDYYYVELTAKDRYAKFTTDTFYQNGKSLAEILEEKQDKFTTVNQLDLSAGLVKGVLPISNGGTGYDNINDATIGKAKHLVNDTGVINKGDGKHPVYFAGGVPQLVSVVENANKLTNDSGVGIEKGNGAKPVYFINGVPEPIGEKIDAYALGLQEGAGNKKTDVPTKMYYTSVYFDDAGKVKKGITINISNKSPEGGDPGEAGDLWFKYAE